MSIIAIQEFSVVSKKKTKKLKRKKSYSDKFKIDEDTLELIEKLNSQIDKAEIEAKKAAMTYIVRKWNRKEQVNFSYLISNFDKITKKWIELQSVWWFGIYL